MPSWGTSRLQPIGTGSLVAGGKQHIPPLGRRGPRAGRPPGWVGGGGDRRGQVHVALRPSSRSSPIGVRPGNWKGSNSAECLSRVRGRQQLGLVCRGGAGATGVVELRDGVLGLERVLRADRLGLGQRLELEGHVRNRIESRRRGRSGHSRSEPSSRPTSAAERSPTVTSARALGMAAAAALTTSSSVGTCHRP